MQSVPSAETRSNLVTFSFPRKEANEKHVDEPKMSPRKKVRMEIKKTER